MFPNLPHCVHSFAVYFTISTAVKPPSPSPFTEVNFLHLKFSNFQSGLRGSGTTDRVAVIEQSAAEHVRVLVDRPNRREICRAALVPNWQ